MKIRKLITLSREIMDDLERKIKEYPEFNFSGWVEDRWIEEEMTEKGLRIKQKLYEKMAKKYKNLVHYSAKKKVQLAEKLTEKQKMQLLSSKKVISKKAEFFEGQLNLWNNKFPNFKLSALQFKELLGLENKK